MVGIQHFTKKQAVSIVSQSSTFVLLTPLPSVGMVGHVLVAPLITLVTVCLVTLVIGARLVGATYCGFTLYNNYNVDE